MICPLCGGDWLIHVVRGPGERESMWFCQDCLCEVDVDEEMVVSETASVKEDAEMKMQITMSKNENTYTFLEYCTSCKRKHRMAQSPCPSCQGRGGDIPMPVSDRVYNECKSTHYKCDGCEAYDSR